MLAQIGPFENYNQALFVQAAVIVAFCIFIVIPIVAFVVIGLIRFIKKSSSPKS